MFAFGFLVLMIGGLVTLAAGPEWGLLAAIAAFGFLGWKALTTNWFG
jgi:hypothetical protein